MKGTLALWYDPLEAPEVAGTPEMDVHVNLWRDLPSRTNFLDLGFLLRDMAKVARFYLYIPERVDAQHIHDLSAVMRSTLTAVFNDVVRFGTEADGHYDILRGSPASSERISIFSLDADDIRVETDIDPVSGVGSRLVFTQALCEKMTKVQGPRYVRFRVTLRGQASTMFSSEIQAKDGVFASATGRLELTEFRLNERRSYPSSIAQRVDLGEFDIRTIHYFLIRDLQHELLVQHAPFEKVRRLEGELWAGYLAGSQDASASGLTAKVAERLVIYHWKAKAKDRDRQSAREANEIGIRDFVAFASFRTSTVHLWIYGVIIVLLGAAGSALASALGASDRLQANLVAHLPWIAPGARHLASVARVNLLLSTVLLLLVLAMAYSRPVLRPILRGMRRLWMVPVQAFRLRFRNRLGGR